MSRPLQSSFHLAMAARLCGHALADREAFAPQDLAALLITLDLVNSVLAVTAAARTGACVAATAIDGAEILWRRNPLRSGAS
jgi:hypothetical protein